MDRKVPDEEEKKKNRQKRNPLRVAITLFDPRTTIMKMVY